MLIDDIKLDQCQSIPDIPGALLERARAITSTMAELKYQVSHIILQTYELSKQNSYWLTLIKNLLESE